MVSFCDVETKTELRLVTNLPDDGDAEVSDVEVRDIYRFSFVLISCQKENSYQ